MEALPLNNPTTAVDLSFARYLETRKQALAEHWVGNVPDYAFALDQVLRQQIAALGPVRRIVQGVLASVEPIQKQLHLIDGVLVGPRQFPEIYALGEDCARRLGIGVPQIIILPVIEFNAYTFATDDSAPLIVMTSLLVSAYEPQELKFIIGHECGHIHNLHSVYNTIVELLTNPLAQAVLSQMLAAGLGLDIVKIAAALIQGGMQLFFARWSRCAEITSDRAGLICCGDLDVAQLALAKLATRGARNLEGINLQEYIRQIGQVQSTPLRLQELFRSHPLVPKRLEALRLFAESDVYYSWRPECRQAGSNPHTKGEVDRLCEQFVSVLATGYRPQ